jgi:hypothetical protein
MSRHPLLPVLVSLDEDVLRIKAKLNVIFAHESLGHVRYIAVLGADLCSCLGSLATYLKTLTE